MESCGFLIFDGRRPDEGSATKAVRINVSQFLIYSVHRYDARLDQVEIVSPAAADPARRGQKFGSVTARKRQNSFSGPVR